MAKKILRAVTRLLARNTGEKPPAAVAEAHRAAQPARPAEPAPVQTPDPAPSDPLSPDEVLARAQHLRPGMTRADVDALAAVSHGMITADKLCGDPGKVWRHDDGRPYRGNRPVVVSFDGDGVLTSVGIRAEFAGMPGLEAGQTVAAVRARYPGCTDIDVGPELEKLGYAKLVLAEVEPGIVLTAAFMRAKGQADTGLLWLTYTTAAEVARQAAQARAHAEKSAEKEAEAARRRDEARRIAEWKRTADPDEVLRFWAKSYSAWGEAPEEWQRFADWLIEASTPEDRHILATAVNWDHGLDITQWVIRQPDTQLATVYEVFWAADPWASIMAIPATMESPAPTLLFMGTVGALTR